MNEIFMHALLIVASYGANYTSGGLKADPKSILQPSANGTNFVGEGFSLPVNAAR